MTNQQNTNTNPATILEFARLQLAAEALYGFKNAKPEWIDSKGDADTSNLLFGVDYNSSKNYKEHLISGNNHNSKFTPTDAAEFAENWEMVAHIANTTTGFSGSLFRAKKDIPGTDIKKGDLTISFRSTEFVDDATRDSQATNTFEIADRGWAFGQISDMVRWVHILQKKGLIDRELNVTGYSLGGHLATAFNILYRGNAFSWQEEGKQYSLNVASTYTFNGAGVGLQKGGQQINPRTLKDIISDFSRNRENGGMAHLFKSEEGIDFYRKLKLALNNQDQGEVRAILDVIKKFIEINNTSGLFVEQIREFIYLKQAGLKILDIWQESLRVKGLSSFGNGKGDRPKITNFEDIAALGLDYQLAVMMANGSTESVSKFIGSGSGLANIINDGRNQAEKVFKDFYDIYGDTFPSMVASSQLHYGKPIGVAIENQPLGRGDYWHRVSKGSDSIFNPKLLVDGYDGNNFGDTHSLALIIDSLSTQSMISKLDGNLDTDSFKKIFRLASNQKALTDIEVKRLFDKYNEKDIYDVLYDLTTVGMIDDGIDRLKTSTADKFFERLGVEWVENSPKGQGYSEGDVLENIINILAKTIGVELKINSKPTGKLDNKLNGDLNGGTWALIDDHKSLDKKGNSVNYTGRESLQSAITQINKFIKDNNLEDAFTILPATEANAQAAATDFGHFIALKTLNPFVLMQKPGLSVDKQAAVTKIWTTVWAEEYRAWQHDFDARQNQRQPDYYTDRWLEDRQILLTIKSYLDITNQPYQIGLDREPLQKWIENASLSNQFPGFTDRLMSVLDSLRSISDAEGGLSYSNTAVRTISGTRDIYWIAKNGRAGIQFGSDDRDELTGSQTVDHLYGGGGNDILKGGDGEDHLEGGSGYDLLYGGKGKDYLNGGTGYDLYIFKSDEIDDDVIVDPDEGEIHIDDKPLKGVHVPPSDYGRWRDEDGYTYITLNERTDGKGGMIADLQIVTPQNKRLTWKDWHYQKNEKGLLGSKFKLALKADKQEKLDVHYMNGDVVAPFKSGTKTYDWEATSWNYATGKLNGGVEAKGFHDVLRGSAAKDVVHGLDGNDAIDGSDGNDILYGDDGHDLITGGKGSDRVFGGKGDDVILGASHLFDYVKWVDANSMGALPKDKTYTYQNGQVWGMSPNAGNPKDRTLYGADIDYVRDETNLEGDYLVGGDGADTVYGSHENDWIYGDEVSQPDYVPDEKTEQGDVLYGLGGDDYIFGGLGDDTLYGDGHINRRLFGYLPAGFHGNDTLYGGEGEDTLYGQLGSDHLYGGADFDVLVGGTDIGSSEKKDDLDAGDYLYGGSGYDLLVGNAGSDYLYGEEDGGRLYGGRGDDFLFSGSNYRKFENGLLPNGQQVTYVTEVNNELYGGSGNDMLYAEGSSVMDGGADNDGYWFDESALYAGAQHKILSDVSGNDTVYFRSVGLNQI